MFAKLRRLERRAQNTILKLKRDQTKLKNMRRNWNNLPDKTRMNDNFSNFVKNQVNDLNVMFEKIFE